MKDLLKIIIYGFLILFVALILAEDFGYYETRDKKIKTLTEEQIKIFEQDIKNGKNIDVTDYVTYESRDYSNNLSNLLYKTSLKLEKTIDGLIKIVFNKAEKMVSD